MNRREALRGLALLGVGCAAGGRRSGGDTAAACTVGSQGDAAAYCLLERLVLRVPGGAFLQEGQAMLGLADDNTAVLIGRDAGGFFARSAVCTHACCVVNLCDDLDCAILDPSPSPCAAVGPASTDRVLCPCHGSVFRVSDGVALSGPATTPLPAYAATLDGDDLLVDTGAAVDAAARTPA